MPADQNNGQKPRRLFTTKQNPQRQSANSGCCALQNAILRLSDQEYETLTKFRADYPNLNIELMGKPANSFILFRSHFVANYKEQHPDMNQKELSKLAGISWKAISNAKQAPYTAQAVEAKRLWETMYPYGLPESLAALFGGLKKRTQGSQSQKRKSASSSRRRHLRLPTPPVSEAVDIQEGAEGDENDTSEGQEVSDNDGGEYIPNSKSCRKSRSSPTVSSNQICPRRQLMTPESMTRELTPATPALSDPDEDTPLFTHFWDVTLAELNDKGPSTFASSQVPPELFATFQPSGYFEQIAVGYNFDEYAGNMIIDWEQTDLMSEFDPVGSYPINNPSYPPNFYMADFKDELGPSDPLIH